MDLNLQANLFIYNAKVGDFYISGENKVEVTKRTEKRIHFSNGVIITIKSTKKCTMHILIFSVITFTIITIILTTANYTQPWSKYFKTMVSW